MSRIFISHSSRNNSEALAIRDWLAAEGWEDVFLDLDPERGIAAGERWERILTQEANRCEAVLFLVSNEWLSSEWCLREFHLASKLSKQVFPLLIDDIPVKKLPSALTRNVQIVNLAAGDDHSPFRAKHPETGQEAHVTFSQNGLKRLRAGLQKAGLDPRFFVWPPADDPQRQPWRGLKPLEAADAGIFYGREGPIITALDRLRGLSEGAPPRLFVILGASGSGKSSFLRAGLWPRLARDDRRYLTLPVIRPSLGVVSGEAGLIRALEEGLRQAGIKINRAAIRDAIAVGSDAVASLVGQIVATGSDEAASRCLLIAIDQAEELFKPAGREEAEQFMALMADLARRDTPRVMLVFTIRSDAYEPLQTAKDFADLQQTLYNLPPMPAGAWGAVVEGPARRLSKAGRKLVIEPQLTSRLLADLEAGGGKDTLPLLSFTLERLYTDYGADGDLKLSEYEQFGGIVGAIDAAVAGALERAAADPRLPPDADARRMLLRRALIPWLAGIDPQTGAPHRMAARLVDIPEESRPLVEHLVEARLLSADLDPATGERMVEPAHEALLRQWGLLKGWLEDDFASLTTLEAVRRATRDWLANARKAEYLNHRASRLADAEALHQRPDLAARLGSDDRTYLAACREAENVAAAKERRATARIKAFAIAASILAIFAGLFAWYGFDRAQEASHQASIAASNEKVAIAQTKIADEERKTAEARRVETAVAGKRTEKLLDLTKAYFMLQDSPKQALSLARDSISYLQKLDGAGVELQYGGFVDFYLNSIVNKAREVPLNNFYADYEFDTLKFVVPQPSEIYQFQLGDGVADSFDPLTIVGSRETVGMVDSNGRPVGKPIRSLDLRLFANDAAWISNSAFVLATGGWGPSSEKIGKIARNSTLQVYSLEAASPEPLIRDHDAPFVSVAVTKASDGRTMIIAGDTLGRLVVVPLEGGTPQIASTGTDLPILKIFPDLVFGETVIVFGRKPSDQISTDSVSPENIGTTSKNLKNANQILAKALGMLNQNKIIWIGPKSGSLCAAKFDGTSIALCTTRGTVQLWSSIELDDIPNHILEPEAKAPEHEFSPFESAPNEILEIADSDMLAIGAIDGKIGLFNNTGKELATFQAARTSIADKMGKLGFLKKRQRIFTALPGIGRDTLKSWDLSDLFDQSHQPPLSYQQLDDELRTLSELYWFKTGDFKLPKLLNEIPGFLKGRDRPRFDYISPDGRFVLGVDKHMLVVADTNVQTINKLELPFYGSAREKLLGETVWRSSLKYSEVIDGRICIVESFSNTRWSNIPTPADRITMIDVSKQKAVFQVPLREKAPAEFVGLFFNENEPICIYSAGDRFKTLGPFSASEIVIDPVQVGVDEDFIVVDSLLSKRSQTIYLVLSSERKPEQNALVQLGLTPEARLRLLAHFDSPPSLLDVTENGEKLLFATSKQKMGASELEINEIRLVDDHFNTVKTWPPLDGVEYHLAEDGLSLRTKSDRGFNEAKLDFSHLLASADRRLLEWSTFEKKKDLEVKLGSCAALNATSVNNCEEALRMAKQQFPDDAVLIRLIGEATKESTAKIDYFNASLLKDPYYYYARYQKSQAYRQLAKYQDEANEYSKILSLPENFPAILGNSGLDDADTLFNAIDNATRHMTKVKRTNLLLHRARVYADLMKWTEALADITTIRELEWETSESFEIQSEALKRIGQYDGSLAAISESLRMFRVRPDWGWLHVSEETSKLSSWQKYKEAQLLVKVAELQQLLGQKNESATALRDAEKLLATVFTLTVETEPTHQLAQELHTKLNEMAK